MSEQHAPPGPVDAIRGECTLSHGVTDHDLYGAGTVQAQHQAFGACLLSISVDDDRATTDATAAVRLKLSSEAAVQLARALLDGQDYRVVESEPDAGHGTVRIGPEGGDER
jgi:hypothetical protein